MSAVTAMNLEIIITESAIDEAILEQGCPMSDGMGAVVRFLGVVRGREEDGPIRAIRYEAYEAMARHQFDVILEEVARRWPVGSVRLVHRVGVVPVGEPSLWVEVVSPHRAEAFAACQYLIDDMKRVVPIWKRPQS